MSPVPLIQPYQEALDFQRKRTAVLSRTFYSRAFDAARPRAFTISGFQRMDLLLAANRVIEEGRANNTTMSDIADQLGELADEQDGLLLPPSRFELIHHNAMVTANAAGAWEQAMEFVEDRPFFQYIGPDDDRISKICLPIHMMIVRYDDPILKHMWGPNHHWERHEWVSLAPEDVNEKDVYESPDGFDYPVVNGQVVRPADGWDFNPADVFAADDKAFVDAANALSDALPARTAADYGLESLAEISVDELPVAPALEQIRITSIEKQWDLFRDVFDIPDGEERTIVLDHADDGVWVNRATFEHLVGVDDPARPEKQIDRARHFTILRATLESPAEVWFVPRQNPAGDVVFTKRYIGMFREDDEATRATVMFFERSPEGWLMSSGRINRLSQIEKFRSGLLTYTKAGRKK